MKLDGLKQNHRVNPPILILYKKKVFFFFFFKSVFLKFNLLLSTHTSTNKRNSRALEGLAAVVNRVTCSAPVPGSTLYVHACHPAVPYLLLGLQDVQWAVGNSRGARKLARTPHVNQKKKKKETPEK